MELLSRSKNQSGSVRSFLRFFLASVFMCLMPCVVHATDYIKDIAVKCSKSSISDDRFTLDGVTYTMVKNQNGNGQDFNQKAGGDFVYIGYTTTTDPSEAISGLYMHYSKNQWSEDMPWTNPADGLTYHRAFTDARNLGDLNSAQDGEGHIYTDSGPSYYIYLFYTKDGNNKDGANILSGLHCTNNKSHDGDWTWFKYSGGDYFDMNKSASGLYIYLGYKQTTVHKKNPTFSSRGFTTHIFDRPSPATLNEKGHTGTVTYSSDNPNVVDVNSESGALTFKDLAGTAKITATFAPADALFGATCSYTISVLKDSFTPTFSSTSVYGTNKSFTPPTLNGLPTSNTDKMSTPTWESNNSDVATVSDNGTVTILKNGTATITVNYPENRYYAARSASYELTAAMLNNHGQMEIENADDWKTFCKIVNSGYTSLDAKMTADVDLGTEINMVGKDLICYSGSFDGNGHTLTVNWNTSSGYIAPFFQIDNATIEWLKTAGSITAKHDISGLVLSAKSNNTISNCMSAVNITATDTSPDGLANVGGLVQYISTGTTTISDCMVTGILDGTKGKWSGFVCDMNSDCSCTISNSLCNVDFQSYRTYRTWCFTFSEQASLTNCYYVNAIGEAQGTQVTAEQLESGEVAWLLQNGRTDATYWGQPIGYASMPAITGDTNVRVYQVKLKRNGEDIAAFYINNGDPLSSIPVLTSEALMVEDAYSGDTKVTGDMTVNVNCAVDYLCFTADEDDSSINLCPNNTNDYGSVQISTNGIIWKDYAYDTEIPLAKKGDKVYFKGNYSGNGVDNSCTFYMTGKIAASGNIMTLTDGDRPSTSLEGKPYAFCRLFEGCEALTSAPKLPAEVLADYCYFQMFEGCKGLKEAPALPSETLAVSCYKRMFPGCSSLTTAPALPAETLAEGCYSMMFEDCSSLTTAPALPAETLAAHCYENMFNGCTSLTSAPVLSAKELEEGCYNGMFAGCTSLDAVTVGFTDWNTSNNATSSWLKDVSPTGTFICLKDLDVSERGISIVPEGWSVQYLPDYLCFTAAEDNSSIKLEKNGNDDIGSVQISTNGITWSDYAYGAEIPLAKKGDKVYFKGNYCGKDPMNYCYFSMTGKIATSGNIMTLTDEDEPTTSLEDKAYAFNQLFNNCQSLICAPELPATTLAASCYYNMFYNCTNLSIAPVLPAETMADECYVGMFTYCKSLKSAPALPAETLAPYCYYEMFAGCTSLTSAPVLSANQLTSYCYNGMFDGCTSLDSVKVGFTNWNEMYDATTNWLNNVSSTGTLICPKKLDTLERGISKVPEGWNVENLYDDYLCFTAQEDNSSIRLDEIGGLDLGNVQISTNGITWSDYSYGTTIPLDKNGHKVYFKGNYSGKSIYDYCQFSMTGKIAASGNVMTLTDGDKPTSSLKDKPYAFHELFMGCESLVSAPALPAETLAEGCYDHMFKNCSSLTTAPALPAETLDVDCYLGMFSYCTSLKSAPALPATTLVINCYQGMFSGCTSLNSVTVGFTDWNTSNLSTLSWLDYVSPTGTLFCPSDLDTSTRNAFTLPEGWNVETPIDYLCFTADEDESSIRFLGNDGMGSVQISTNGITWRDYNDSPEISLAKKGDKVYFKGNYCGNNIDYCWFTMTGKIAASGNIMTLTDGDKPTTSLKDKPFAFTNLFRDCSSLITAPELPAKTLAEGCYQQMFQGCTSLATAPVLSAQTLAKGCYDRMFYGCNSLNSAKVAFTDWSIYDFDTSSWMYYVSSTGTFICPKNLDTSIRSTSRVPEGWNVEYIYDDYLCFTADEDNSTISFNKEGSEDIGSVQISTDGFAWEDYAYGTEIPLAKKGDKVYFRGNYSGKGLFDYCHFAMTGKIAASGNIMTLTDGNHPTTSLKDKPYAFSYLFDNCASLTSAPMLPAETLAAYCYQFMFSGCTSLKSAPMLPAETLAEGCYARMFVGCTSLTIAPVLPAETLTPGCYANLFGGCTSLNSVTAAFTDWSSSDNATENWLANVSPTGTFICSEDLDTSTRGAWTVPEGWNVEYPSVPYLCFTANEDESSIILNKKRHEDLGSVQFSTNGIAWKDYTYSTELPLAKKGDKVYFRGNYSGRGYYDYCCFSMTGKIAASGNIMTLTDGDEPTTSLKGKPFAFKNLFRDCSSLITAPELPADILDEDCYNDMFYGCSSLTTAPKLPATTLTSSCYNGMFTDCTSLATAPELPADKLAVSCYTDMFNGCSSLVTAPALPATTLADNCYEYMFLFCTSLTTAPALPATTLAESCYYAMFSYCTSLTSAPALPATTLAESCYMDLFSNCTSLTSAPALPATTLAKFCYYRMFSHCTSLATAPALPATTLAERCYTTMFSHCTSLTSAPALPAKELEGGCYYEMFYKCKSIKSITVNFTDWKNEYTTENWVDSVSSTGTFICPKDLDTSIRSTSRVPEGWNVQYIGESLPGDANGDGSVTITDALAVVYHVLNKTVENFDEKAADMDGSGDISITDALAIVKAVLGGNASAKEVSDELLDMFDKNDKVLDPQ